MMNNPMALNQLMQKVQQLKAQLGGDPNQQIQQLLNSGKITQADYDRAVQRANELKRMFGMK
jgi:hypothetical protein